MKRLHQFIVLSLILAIGLSTLPAGAEDSANEGSSGLYRKMYEGGLITEEEHEYALKEGHLPGGHAAESSQPQAEVSPLLDDPLARDVEEEQIPPEKHLTRALSINGGTLTVKELRQHQRSRLATRAKALRTRQMAARAEAKAYATRHGIPLTEHLADGTILEMMQLANGVPLYYTTHNLNAADTVSTDEVWPGGQAGTDVTGTNTTLGMWDADAVRDTHQEFSVGGSSRVTQMDGETNLHYHSTAVAGTLIAAGLWTSAIGMSFEADLSAYDWELDLSEMADAVASNGLRLSNHSYSFTTGWESNSGGFWVWYGDIGVSTLEDYKFGFYREESRDIDEIAYDGNYYLSVWSAANERDFLDLGPASQPVFHYAFATNGFVWTNLVHNSDGDAGGYDTLSPQAVAKNALTVGAVEDIPGGYSDTQDVVLATFSSLGPTDDGRLKPDLVANGIGLITTHSQNDNAYVEISGTSFSAPNLAGSLNLLLQLYTSLHGTNYPMLASTLKGLAIHTADAAGDSLGPDYQFGWGLLNIRSAAQLTTNNFASGSKAHIKEVILLDDDYIEFPVVATNSQTLKVTICWTDPPGTAPAWTVDPTNLLLINDLDLRVIDPSGTTNMPWILNPSSPSNAATTGDNFRDNVEQVYIESPTNGIYTVRVTHKGTLSNGLQNVSVLLSGNVPQTKPTLEIVDFEATTAPTNTLEWPTVVGQLSRVQSCIDLVDGTWTDASGDISATRTNVIYAVSTNPVPELLFYRVLDVN